MYMYKQIIWLYVYVNTYVIWYDDIDLPNSFISVWWIDFWSNAAQSAFALIP